MIMLRFCWHNFTWFLSINLYYLSFSKGLHRVWDFCLSQFAFYQFADAQDASPIVELPLVKLMIKCNLKLCLLCRMHIHIFYTFTIKLSMYGSTNSVYNFVKKERQNKTKIRIRNSQRCSLLLERSCTE